MRERTEEEEYLRSLLVLADSNLSLLRWRYGVNVPQDLKTEIDNLIAKIRRVT